MCYLGERDRGRFGFLGRSSATASARIRSSNPLDALVVALSSLASTGKDTEAKKVLSLSLSRRDVPSLFSFFHLLIRQSARSSHHRPANPCQLLLYVHTSSLVVYLKYRINIHFVLVL